MRVQIADVFFGQLRLLEPRRDLLLRQVPAVESLRQQVLQLIELRGQRRIVKRRVLARHDISPRRSCNRRHTGPRPDPSWVLSSNYFGSNYLVVSRLRRDGPGVLLAT